MFKSVRYERRVGREHFVDHEGCAGYEWAGDEVGVDYREDFVGIIHNNIADCSRRDDRDDYSLFHLGPDRNLEDRSGDSSRFIVCKVGLKSVYVDTFNFDSSCSYLGRFPTLHVTPCLGTPGAKPEVPRSRKSRVNDLFFVLVPVR